MGAVSCWTGATAPYPDTKTETSSDPPSSPAHRHTCDATRYAYKTRYWVSVGETLVPIRSDDWVSIGSHTTKYRCANDNKATKKFLTKNARKNFRGPSFRGLSMTTYKTARSKNGIIGKIFNFSFSVLIDPFQQI